MTTELTLIRHAQSKAQTGEQAWLDPELSDLGRQQARRVAGFFSGTQYDLAIVSPLRRARTTFELARIRAHEIRFDSRLVEVTLGRGPGYDYREILPYTTPTYGTADAADMWNAPAGVRAASLLSELRGFPGRVIMVGHCGIFHVVRAYLSGDPIEGEPVFTEELRSILMDNVALSTAEVGVSPRKDRILEWNRPILSQQGASRSAFV